MENDIYYSSFDYQFNHIIDHVFLIKNKEDAGDYQKITSNLLSCSDILVFNKKFYVEIYLFFNNDKFSTDDIKKNALKIKAKSLYEKYTQFDCRNSFKIFPNENDKDFYLEFFDFSKINLIRLKEKTVIDLVIPFDNFNFFIKENKANKKLDISEFLNRKQINDIERKFIIQNFHNEINGVRPEKIEETEKKDLFVDFMNIDDFSGNSFIITEQEREIFNPESLKIVDGFKDPSFEMNRLVGLKNVKKEILKLNAKINYQYDRISRNIFDSNIHNLHMCFYGNPGTGKTTVARIITSILYNMGYIKRNKCIEINANEFKGSKIGETAIKTKVILRNSMNKVLFIDEAYALYDKRDGFGQEAVDTIIKEMEDNKQNMVLIFAGYKEEMQDFIRMNEGLKSRISRYIEFENYSCLELCKIFANILHENNLKIETNAFIRIIHIFKEMLLQNNFSNGRFVRNLYEQLLEEHAFNVKEGNASGNIITSASITDNLIEQLYIQNKNVNF